MQRILRLLGTMFLFYILQTTVLPHFFRPSTIQPDLLLAFLVAISLKGDRYVGFCTGAMIGLLMDAMVGQIALLYLITYPLIGYTAARISPFLIEIWPWERAKLLIPSVTAAFLTLLYEIVLLVYRYLSGVDVTFSSVGRMTRSVLYTAIAAWAVQYIVRFCMRELRPKNPAIAPEQH